MNFSSPDPLPGSDGRFDWLSLSEARQALRTQDRFRRASLGRTEEMRRNRVMTRLAMFPFKIYLAQLALGPPGMLADYPDPTTWWRTFLVRCGEVNGVAVTGAGCDGYDTDPDSDFFPDEVTPFVVPAATAQYYVWIGGALGAPTLSMGASITGDWPSYPAMDGVHWLVGIINTQKPYQAVVRQTLRADITLLFQSVQVCVGGVWKTMLVCGSTPA